MPPPRKPPAEPLGARIRRLRLAANLTCEGCAAAAGWARASSWADLETARRPDIRLSTLRTVAGVLSVDLAVLVDNLPN